MDMSRHRFSTLSLFGFVAGKAFDRFHTVGLLVFVAGITHITYDPYITHMTYMI